MWYIYTMEYYSIYAIENTEILPLATTLQGPWGHMISKISQGERQIAYNLTYMWDLKQQITNEQKNWVHGYRE